MTRNEVEFEDIATLMKAIVKIADGQYDLKTSVDHLSDKVARLEDRIPQEDEIVKVFKDYMKLSPDELALANTMGYRYEGVVNILSMKEIKGRVARIQQMYGKSADLIWKRKVCESIGKNLAEIRMEAQAFNIKNGCPKAVRTFCDAVATIPEYLKWGTKILLDMENEVGIRMNPYTRYDLFKTQNHEFNKNFVLKLPPDEFREWLNRRIKDTMLMCDTDAAGAKEITLNMLFLHSHWPWMPKGLTDNLDTVFERICNEPKNTPYRDSLKNFVVEQINLCFVI